MSDPTASGNDDERSAANERAPSGTLRLAVNGAGGRMGRQLLQAIEERDGARLVAAADAPGGEVVGLDAGVLSGSGVTGTVLSGDLLADAAFADVDVVIDFTTPAASIALLEGLAARGGSGGCRARHDGPRRGAACPASTNCPGPSRSCTPPTTASA